MIFGYPIQALIWDAMILGLIGGSIWLEIKLILCIRKGAQYRFRIPVMVLIAMLGIGCLLTIYGSFIEPWIITITEHDVVLPIEEELTIVLLSDLHLGPYKGRSFLQRLITRVNALEPDLILLTGDFLYMSDYPPEILLPLQDLRARYGVFASLGNYSFGYDIRYYLWGNDSPDRSNILKRTLERAGIRVLRNEYVEVAIAGGSFFLGGIDDPSVGRDIIRDALPDVRRGLPIILLSHSPDIILQAEARRPHLIVSGHTHGGQIRLPFIGSLMGLPIQIDKKYAQGKHVIDDDSTIIITRGVGETGPRARLFARPEIVIIRSKVKVEE